MARNYIKTVKDMEEYFYGRGLELQKADSPVLSTHLIYNNINGIILPGYTIRFTAPK